MTEPLAIAPEKFNQKDEFFNSETIAPQIAPENPLNKRAPEDRNTTITISLKLKRRLIALQLPGEGWEATLNRLFEGTATRQAAAQVTQEDTRYLQEEVRRLEARLIEFATIPAFKVEPLTKREAGLFSLLFLYLSGFSEAVRSREVEVARLQEELRRRDIALEELSRVKAPPANPYHQPDLPSEPSSQPPK